MKITVVGCGNFNSNGNGNQSFLLDEEDNKLLIDCSVRDMIALARMGVSPKDINAIYISHAHGDHISGLEELAFTRYDWMHMPKKHSVEAPKLIAEVDLLQALWRNSLRGGMNTLDFESGLDTWFNAIPVVKEFFWTNWRMQLVRQLHAAGAMEFSYGLLATSTGHKSIYFTTDTRFNSPGQMEVYQKADLIIQDCECSGVNTLTRAPTSGSGAHANYMQLITLPADIKAKMLLSHYQEFVSNNIDAFGNICDWELMAKADGFQGFVKPAQEIYI